MEANVIEKKNCEKIMKTTYYKRLNIFETAVAFKNRSQII